MVLVTQIPLPLLSQKENIKLNFGITKMQAEKVLVSLGEQIQMEIPVLYKQINLP